MRNNIQNAKVLLLLSGGKDSALVAEILKKQNCEIIGLCISGIQKKEIVGARIAAQKNKFKLICSEVSFFDEETWNPIKLILRDIAMGVLAIYYCKKNNIRYLVAGVKDSDLSNSKLRWLNNFLKISSSILKLFRIELVLPLCKIDS